MSGNGPADRGKGGWDEVLAAEGHLVAPGAEWRSELYRIAVAQFERAADVLDLDPDLRQRLLEPRRSLVVNFPVRRDDGEVQEFTGYRVQHTLVMGPTKGGAKGGSDQMGAATAKVIEASERLGVDWAIYP